jgi:hypothetical protein
MISINSSNNIADCDALFLPDFVKLDKIVSKLEKKKHDDLQALYDNMTG